MGYNEMQPVFTSKSTVVLGIHLHTRIGSNSRFGYLARGVSILARSMRHLDVHSASARIKLTVAVVPYKRAVHSGSWARLQPIKPSSIQGGEFPLVQCSGVIIPILHRPRACDRRWVRPGKISTKPSHTHSG